MTIAVLPGSFDPITNGHVDLIRRASRLADTLIVAVGSNIKKSSKFTATDRVAMILAATADLPGVHVRIMGGLLVDLCHEVGADFVVKGVRNAADATWEITQATINRELGEVETIFIPTKPELLHVSSSFVKELSAWGMDVSRYVPAGVARAMADNRIIEPR